MPGTGAEAGRTVSRRTAGGARGGRVAGDGGPVPRAREGERGLAARSTGEALGGDQFRARPAAEVLADRLAMALVHHEPGWRLPRHTVLARRYSVSTAEIDAAISALVGRHLVRRLPDGQVHRVSPAEYLIPLEGIPGLRSRIDPMAGELTLRTRQTSWRRVPEDIAWALRVDPAAQVWVVHTVWAAGDEPAAYVMTYLPADTAGAIPGTDPPGTDESGDPAAAGPADEPAGIPPDGDVGEAAGARSPPGGDVAAMGTVGQAAALHVEMQPPPPSIARSLRLSAGQPAAKVTVRFDDPATGRPAALTVTVLRPELFRIVVQTAEAPLPGEAAGSVPGAWIRTIEGWES
jgi:DNA-binding GntR family transcriptional regulator